ncbi:MAG TPA: cytochrome C oxidase subunit IV family protein [Reyranella sp.]|jgi:cytochrome c oxidase subunit 4|nr:cytochrome C oxidase subunit IV family protein [Reyranella sp.]
MREAYRRVTIVWVALLALLGSTIGASYLFAGATSVAVSLGIAFAKVALVFWFFMQLRSENGMVRVFAVGAAVWLMLLFGLGTMDYATRLSIAGF